MKILFFGTPEFAVPSLEKILNSSHEVVGVVTQPDRPKGRFQSPVASPIKELATDRSIPSLQPDQLGSETFLDQVRSWMPDAAAVVAYGKIFPRRLLDLFPKGTINLHASLLPQYRGAAPIQWAILNGDTQTGLTTFMIDEQLDHGPILKQLPISIDPQETAIGLSQRMAPAGSGLLLETLDEIQSGQLIPKPQNESQATEAPMLKKSDGRIDWSREAQAIANQVRAFQPWPGATTFLDGKPVKLLVAQAYPEKRVPSMQPGQIAQADPAHGLWVQTGKGQLQILRLQMAGGKALETPAFLRGHPLPLNTTLQ